MRDGLAYLWLVLLGTLACLCVSFGILSFAGLVMLSTGHAEMQDTMSLVVPVLGTLALFAAAAILFGALIRAFD